MRLFGTPNVEKLTAKRKVKRLIKALDNHNPSGVRQTAAQALGRIGEPRAVDPLIATLTDETPGVRQTAAQALGRIGEPRAVDPLIATLTDETPGVRSAAAEALGEIGDARAVEPLIATLTDETPGVRNATAKALDGLAWSPDSDSGTARIAYWAVKRNWDKCVEMGEPAVEPLIAVFTRDRSGGAAQALGEIGDARAVKPLIAALTDESGGVRSAAARALGEIGDARAVKPLIAALTDEDWVVRDVARALGRIGASAVGPAIAALAAPDQPLRSAAARALGEIGKPAVAPLLAALTASDPDVRDGAAWALGQIGDACTVAPLIAALRPDDREGNTGIAVTSALIRLGIPGLQALRDFVSTNDVVLPYVCADQLLSMLNGAQSESRRLAAGIMLSMGAQARAAATLTMVTHGYHDEMAHALRQTPPTVRHVISRDLADETVALRVRLAYYSCLDLTHAKPPLREPGRQRLVDDTAAELRRLATRTRTERFIAGYSDVTSYEDAGPEGCLSVRSIAYGAIGYETVTSSEPYYETREVSDPDRASIQQIIEVIPRSLRTVVKALSGSAESEFDQDP